MILGDGPRWLRGTRVPRQMSVRILSLARFAPSDVPEPDARNFGQHFLRPLLTRMSMEAPASAVFRFKCFFGTGHLQFGPDDERAKERQIGALFGMQEVSELRLHLRTAV